MNSNPPILDEVLESLSQRQLNGLIIYSDSVVNILRPGYLYYFSGFRTLGPHNAAVIARSGDTALLVQPTWDEGRATIGSWIDIVKGCENFTEDLINTLRQLKIKGTVGVAGHQDMPWEIYHSIAEEVSLEPAEDIIEEIARNKTDDQINLARKTARIADIGFEVLMEKTRTGIREYELAAEIGSAMTASGADDNFVLMSSEKSNYAMHAPTDKRLDQGDILIAEITTVCQGQFIQLCRTITLGKPSPIVAEKYSLLVNALEESLKQIRPGVPASVISKATNKVLSEAGYAKYCYPPYMRARGHGFGVGSVAPGQAIDDDTEINLEEGQVIISHPNQYLPETGYLACGETILVTSRGLERLATSESKLYSLEG